MVADVLQDKRNEYWREKARTSIEQAEAAKSELKQYNSEMLEWYNENWDKKAGMFVMENYWKKRALSAEETISKLESLI